MDNNIVSTLNHISGDLSNIKIRLNFLLKGNLSKKMTKLINKYIETLEETEDVFHNSIKRQIEKENG